MILNSDSLTPRSIAILVAECWIFSITMFLRCSSMSLVSAKKNIYRYRDNQRNQIN